MKRKMKINNLVEEDIQVKKEFIDKDADLTLSSIQRQNFYMWKEIIEVSKKANLFISKKNIKIGSICCNEQSHQNGSFVSAVCALLNFERKFKKVIFKDRIKYFPKQGIARIELYRNGKIVSTKIDDNIPINKNEEILLSRYKSNSKECFLYFLEKAFNKMNNQLPIGNIDPLMALYSLTAWIPVIYNIHEEEFQSNQCWNHLKYGTINGIALSVAISGTHFGDELFLRRGVSYSILDSRESKGKRQLKLKNPFCDKKNWHKEKFKLVKDGIFWIDYKDFLKHFDSFYLFYNPEIFEYNTPFIKKALEPSNTLHFNFVENP